jgi:hypothetical protein
VKTKFHCVQTACILLLTPNNSDSLNSSLSTVGNQLKFYYGIYTMLIEILRVPICVRVCVHVRLFVILSVTLSSVVVRVYASNIRV